MNRQIRQTEDVGASWRSGYAEDCKSLHPGSIPGEASIFQSDICNAYSGVQNQR